MLKVLEAEDASAKARPSADGGVTGICGTHGTAAISSEKANPGLDQLATLSVALATAEIETFRLKTELTTTKAILADPALVKKYVMDLESKGHEAGDSELAQLRGDLQRYQLSLATASQTYGLSSKVVAVLEADIASLASEVERKERDIVDANVTALTQQLADAKTKQDQVRAALRSSRRPGIWRRRVAIRSA